MTSDPMGIDVERWNYTWLLRDDGMIVMTVRGDDQALCRLYFSQENWWHLASGCSQLFGWKIRRRRQWPWTKRGPA